MVWALILAFLAGFNTAMAVASFALGYKFAGLVNGCIGVGIAALVAIRMTGGA